MVVLDSTRLVIPTTSQKVVLTELHRAHSGMAKTYAIATEKLHQNIFFKMCNLSKIISVTGPDSS